MILNGAIDVIGIIIENNSNNATDINKLKSSKKSILDAVPRTV